jgi:hypothetical protein
VRIELLFGALLVAVVIAFIVTGRASLGRGTGGIFRIKSPRAFWITSALLAAWGGYLIYNGLANPK